MLPLERFFLVPEIYASKYMYVKNHASILSNWSVLVVKSWQNCTVFYTNKIDQVVQAKKLENIQHLRL